VARHDKITKLPYKKVELIFSLRMGIKMVIRRKQKKSSKEEVKSLAVLCMKKKPAKK
jgi:hypothetical protein